MIRNYNYTNRVEINKSDVKIKTMKRGDSLSFVAGFNFDLYEFKNEAKVYVEPYYKNTYMRFDFGTVSEIKAPTNTDISQLSVNSNILFRIKVVEHSDSNSKIVGHIKELRPESEDESVNSKLPLLHTEFTNLDQVPWKITTDPFPTLELNNKIPEIQTKILKDEIYTGLIIPSAFRIVLNELVNDTDNFETDTDSWNSRWLIFTKNVLKVKWEPDFNDQQSMTKWVDEICNEFCNHHQFVSIISKL